jgi:hypothetical protein
MCQGKAQRKASVHEALSHGFRGRLMAGRWGYSVVYFCLVELYLKFWLLKVKTPGKSLEGLIFGLGQLPLDLETCCLSLVVMLLHQNADAFNQVMAQKNEAHKVLSATRVYFACVAEKMDLCLLICLFAAWYNVSALQHAKTTCNYNLSLYLT